LKEWLQSDRQEKLENQQAQPSETAKMAGVVKPQTSSKMMLKHDNGKYSQDTSSSIYEEQSTHPLKIRPQF